MDNKHKSLETLSPIETTKLMNAKYHEELETYRNELHRELAMEYPCRTDTLNSRFLPSSISKSTAATITRDGNKSTLTFDDRDIPHIRSNNLTTIKSAGFIEKQSEILNRLMPNDSQYSLDEHQQHIEWNLKAQEGIITYQLPDGLPDGVSLQNKLQKLMKTNTILLNSRNFWTKLESRFKNLRKQNFKENMIRLRQIQQQYEQALITKGRLPHTTEDAIRQYAEQQRIQMKMNKINTDNSNNKKCLIDYVSSTKKLNDKSDEELETYEIGQADSRFHEIFTDYKFQTKLGKDIGEKIQNDLSNTQERVKTIFPKTNQKDLILQDLENLKSSEALYAYSNLLSK